MGEIKLVAFTVPTISHYLQIFSDQVTGNSHGFHMMSSKLKKKKGIINPFEILVYLVIRTAEDLFFFFTNFQFDRVFRLVIKQG